MRTIHLFYKNLWNFAQCSYFLKVSNLKMFLFYSYFLLRNILFYLLTAKITHDVKLLNYFVINLNSKQNYYFYSYWSQLRFFILQNKLFLAKIIYYLLKITCILYSGGTLLLYNCKISKSSKFSGVIFIKNKNVFKVLHCV